MPEPKDILALNTSGKELLRLECQHTQDLSNCISKFVIELTGYMTSMPLSKPSLMASSNVNHLHSELWTMAELALGILQSHTENLKKMQSMSISEESKELICC